MSRRLLVPALLGLAGTVLAVPASAEAAAPTCDGRPATVVGSPTGSVTGTSGDDVIVTGGAYFVVAGAGDDLICITGDTGSVDAGAGDDRVLGQQTRGAFAATALGPGADVFVGGPEDDQVLELGEDVAAQPTGRDTISTGAGQDEVELGLDDASFLEPVRDQVDLGPDQNSLFVRGEPAPGFRAVGSGDDAINLYAPGGAAAGWAFDAVTGRLRHAADTYVTSGFTSVDLLYPASSFRGGPAAESVTIDQPAGALTLGGGRDNLYLGRPQRPITVDGGPGRDRLYSGRLPGARSTIDVRRHRLTDDAGVAPTITLAGFENYDVTARRLTFRGSAASEVLFGSACRVRAVGRGGADRLRVLSPPRSYGCTTVRGVLRGGPGRDRLFGTWKPNGGADRLLGGPGRDVADGYRGRDLCRTEVRRHCERR